MSSNPDFHNQPVPLRAVSTPPVVYAISPYSNGTCLAALILGLCTFITFGATGIPALICGHIGLNQCKRGEANQKGMAVTGLVLGYLTVAGWSLYFIFMFVVIAAGGGS